MRAASQLSGRGPTDVDVAPVPARSITLRLDRTVTKSSDT